MEYDVMVSVCCLTYNHKKYIRHCLDGFIMQKTNFKFEVLIHDDASTDGTQDIIKEYEEKYPDIIKPIYQTENQYSKHIGINRTFQYPRVTGKYIALCEGDDYWSDPNKLQKQFDAMEKNPNCIVSVHKVRHIYEDGRITKNVQPSICLQDGIITSNEYLKIVGEKLFYPFQTSSYFFCSYVLNEIINNRPTFMKVSPSGDTSLMLYLVNIGDIYYIDEEMSYYRLFSQGSFTSASCENTTLYLLRLQKDIQCLIDYNKYSNYKYNKSIQTRIAFIEFKKLVIQDNISIFDIIKYKNVFKSYNIKEQISCIIHALLPKSLSKFIVLK